MEYTEITIKVPVGMEEIAKNYMLEAIGIKIKEDAIKQVVEEKEAEVASKIEEVKAENGIIKEVIELADETGIGVDTPIDSE